MRIGYYRRVVKPKRLGRGPRIGTRKGNRSLVTLTMISNKELSTLSISPREKNKVFKELKKRGLSFGELDIRKN